MQEEWHLGAEIEIFGAVIAMKLTKLIGKIGPVRDLISDIFNREVKMSSRIEWSYFLTPEIYITKNGTLGAVIQLEGIPFEVQDDDTLNQEQASFGFLLQSLGEEYGFYVTTHRHQQATNVEGDYPEGFAKDFSHAYLEQFRGEKLFVNDIYLNIILRPDTTKVIKGFNFIQGLSAKKSFEKEFDQQEKKIKKFKTALHQILLSLKAYSPRLLNEKVMDNALSVAEPLGFLSVITSGQLRGFSYPLQNIASYISDKRLYFGFDTFHIQGKVKGDDTYGAIVSIKEYNPSMGNGYLDELLTLPFEYINTHSYLSIEKNSALKLIEKQEARLNSADDAAKTQIRELRTAMDDLQSGKIGFGLHHNTVTVLSDSIESLEEKVAQVIKVYQNKRIVVVRETINLENAFWAQIPGNTNNIKRGALISTNNFSCYCSLHNYYSGYIDGNHLGGAGTLVETASKTPLFFNLHEKASGRKDDLPKGHTTLIAPSGGGKTVILMAIDALYQKYDPKSIIFDRGRGCEIAVLANNGVYNRLLPGVSTGWNPFQLPDTHENKKFLRDFLEVLCQSKSSPLTARDMSIIAEVVERNYSLPVEKRNLSNISTFFDLDFSGLDALGRYIREPDRHGKPGDRAYLFDNDTDNLNLDPRKIGFDMTHWLSDGVEQPEELLPISMYLFHRITESLNGQLTILFLDEGWQFLSQPYWVKRLEAAQVTWRKKNGLIFFASQRPDQIAASSLGVALIQSSATNIFLPNPKANEEDYIKGFNLTHKEFEIIKNTPIQSRYFLYKQGQEAAIARMNLSGLDQYLAVLSSNDNTVVLCEEIREEVGEDPKKWLPIFYERVLR